MKHTRVHRVEFTDEFFVLHYEDGRRLSVPLAWYPELRDAPKQTQDGYSFYSIFDVQFVTWSAIKTTFAVDALLQVCGPIQKWWDDDEEAEAVK